MDLYAEELKVWKECGEWRRGLGVEEGKEEVRKEMEVEEVRKVPGAFEW